MIALLGTVFFIFVCLVGIGYRVRALREVSVDRRYVEAKYGNGVKEAAMIIADGLVESEWLGLGEKLVFLTIGVFALFVHPPPGGAWFLAFRVYLFVALTLIVVARVARSYRGLRERRRVLQLEREEDLAGGDSA